ncbi:hypothetical protein EZMO1_2152 [Endozoicomonas montiporae CL-33]|uniref:Uncharacterized protein n=1 Tax=Endozoicomonas montiporae CL-33 TaxID=570277 RepID=A0A142BBY7_9GAMM|nr:hypothetical protein EZMO1_2152 [Endozoicomonas montiporae CL-33]
MDATQFPPITITVTPPTPEPVTKNDHQTTGISVEKPVQPTAGLKATSQLRANKRLSSSFSDLGSSGVSVGKNGSIWG